MKLPDLFRARWTHEVAALILFLALALTLFAPVLSGGATLLPLDNLYRFPPWQPFANSFGVGQPHNTLLDDLVLENYPWKKFIDDSLRQGELPLWNPYILAGQPFMAAGQNAALYPFSLLFILLPLTYAYGLFVALHFWIAAASMYLLARVLGLRPFAATLSGIVYAFSDFMVVSVVFPMVISAAAWLPAILALLELTLREEERRLALREEQQLSLRGTKQSWSDPTEIASPQTTPRAITHRAYSFRRELLYALFTIILLGVQFLAGHVEISYYILMVVGLYAAWRTLPLFWRAGRWQTRAREFGRVAVGLALIVGLGGALAAIQLVPLYELVQRNFRSGSASLAQVTGWALPIRQVLTFIIPDFFGNPAHHSYLDVFDWTTRPAPNGALFWGIKNYVEAGSYVGILPLALALIAVIASVSYYLGRIRHSKFKIQNSGFRIPTETSPRGTQSEFFAVLALLSLLFAFGTPLYSVLFYLLPGYNQLHTAFRWIFPYTLSIAFLAGAGAQLLQEANDQSSWRRVLDWGLIAGGIAVLLALGLSLVWPAPFLRVADWVAAHDLAQPVFGNGRVFWSYEFRPLLLLGLFMLGAGVVLRLARLGTSWRGWRLWQPLALAVVALDLLIAGSGFNPAADPRLVDFIPPAIRFLQADHSLFRITSYDLGEQTVQNPATGAEELVPPQRILNANAGMYFGLSDIRGYDSIIPKQYADFMSALAPQDELLYNRIAPFYNYQPLSSPLLNLLNVKYVLTTRAIPNPGYALVYDSEIKIYENRRVLPRALMVSRGRVIPNPAEMLQALPSFDPAQEVLLDTPVALPANTPTPLSLTRRALQQAAALPVSPYPEITKYGGSEVVVQTNAAQAAYLVLADSYFPGWIAQIDGQDTPLYRADYNFRAVAVPAGAHTVRFRYSPLSLKVGAVGSLVAAVVVLFGFIVLAWQQFFGLQLGGEGAQVQVIARNSVVPMVSSFITQGISFAFALVMLRVLGPENVGRYTFAVTVWFFTSSVTDFGLGILMTREVSRDKSQANRYLTNTAILRTALTLAAALPLALFVALYVALFQLTTDTVIAIALLWLGLFPTNLAASLSFLFNAHERFEYPTAVALGTVLLSVTLQLAALLGGFGIIGLAAVSIISNLFTLGVMYYLVRAILFKPRWEWDPKLVRWMFFESYPLMLNNLLANLFFKIDVFLLKPLTNDLILGYYSTAYKFINALNFIPSNFTLAIFPMLSRQATSAKDAMYRALIVSLKLLLWVSLPITVASVFVAREIIQLYGGAAYLPDSQIALQWLIWFLPFSFVNSVVHYVLIALDQQRFLTKAFLIGLVFNIAANLTAIPLLSYRGAALVTVLSEIALLIPFYYSLRKHLAPLPLLDLIWRPVIASGGMAATFYLLLPRLNWIGVCLVAALVYGGMLLALGALGPDEWLLVRKLAPPRLGRIVDFLSARRAG
ncbi:MAG: oligosaccharide flippase family protein [Anaerolineae bacterium]